MRKNTGPDGYHPPERPCRILVVGADQNAFRDIVLKLTRQRGVFTIWEFSEAWKTAYPKRAMKLETIDQQLRTDQYVICLGEVTFAAAIYPEPVLHVDGDVSPAMATVRAPLELLREWLHGQAWTAVERRAPILVRLAAERPDLRESIAASVTKEWLAAGICRSSVELVPDQALQDGVFAELKREHPLMRRVAESALDHWARRTWSSFANWANKRGGQTAHDRFVDLLAARLIMRRWFDMSSPVLVPRERVYELCEMLIHHVRKVKGQEALAKVLEDALAKDRSAVG